ncbi:hypothetical protein L1D31_22225 [Vibrio sp. Isolate23]|uniref:hypothetical protein n=1 Tax=Vibrio sp. Isolate23 TaxID=2908533 RepID=UPI001EFCF4E7|nr:hypothetical protein [Vibrio sp. Isolate23]MCG9685237.1 hypothetical protein [Vibrio sp. Isolate23]
MIIKHLIKHKFGTRIKNKLERIGLACVVASTLSYSSFSYSGDNPDFLSRLAITSNGQPSASIYANGNMQMEADINWEWDESFPDELRHIKEIRLLDFQSHQDIQDVVVDWHWPVE